LTFDLCEQPHEVTGYQGEIVDFLREHGVKATFFLGGKWMLTHAPRAQQLMSDPLFEVGNHAWEHRNFRVIDNSTKLDEEVTKPLIAYEHLRTNLTARACVGPEGPAYRHVPDHMSLFRFPFGACNPAALAKIEARGLRAIQWDVSSGDPWIGQTVEKMTRDVLKRVRPGSIVLFHANGRGWHTGQAIPMIVRELRAKGYDFVTVTELLRTPGAQPVVSQACYDEKPGDTDRYDSLARSLEVQHAKAVDRIRAKTALTRGKAAGASGK
jgi:peptidoglycan/xylan/chitin deacetylase (PgdA/CDA1 family)